MDYLRALSAGTELAETETAFYTKSAGLFEFKVYHDKDSIWILTEMPNGDRMAFRAAFSPGGPLQVKKNKATKTGILLQLDSDAGTQKVLIDIDQQSEVPILRYTNTLIPAKDLLIPSA